jgi:hypothetical protein
MDIFSPDFSPGFFPDFFPGFLPALPNSALYRDRYAIGVAQSKRNDNPATLKVRGLKISSLESTQ